MSDMQYVVPEKLLLKNSPQYDEAWLQARIKENPAILGLGDLEIKDAERMHPKAGRLDLLLRNPETGKRFEVELMLGAVDESHIIRTIEYWDIERKRYPQYDHCAVIVAENITARFLNVIGLFNGTIPIVAIQLNALKVENKILLNFTKVMDEVVLGVDDEDEDLAGQTTDRNYWENKASVATVKIADECLSILKEVNPKLDLKYNKFYIGLVEGNRANNFVLFRAKKQFLRVEAVLSDQESWFARLDSAGIEILEGEKARKRTIFRITAADVKKHHNLLKELFEAAYKEQQN